MMKLMMKLMMQILVEMVQVEYIKILVEPHEMSRFCVMKMKMKNTNHPDPRTMQPYMMKKTMIKKRMKRMRMMIMVMKRMMMQEEQEMFWQMEKSAM
jgi:hypothetical protein